MRLEFVARRRHPHLMKQICTNFNRPCLLDFCFALPDLLSMQPMRQEHFREVGQNTTSGGTTPQFIILRGSK